MNVIQRFDHSENVPVQGQEKQVGEKIGNELNVLETKPVTSNVIGIEDAVATTQVDQLMPKTEVPNSAQNEDPFKYKESTHSKDVVLSSKIEESTDVEPVADLSKSGQDDTHLTVDNQYISSYEFIEKNREVQKEEGTEQIVENHKREDSLDETVRVDEHHEKCVVELVQEEAERITIESGVREDEIVLKEETQDGVESRVNVTEDSIHSNLKCVDQYTEKDKEAVLEFSEKCMEQEVQNIVEGTHVLMKDGVKGAPKLAEESVESAQKVMQDCVESVQNVEPYNAKCSENVIEYNENIKEESVQDTQKIIKYNEKDTEEDVQDSTQSLEGLVKDTVKIIEKSCQVSEKYADEVLKDTAKSTEVLKQDSESVT